MASSALLKRKGLVKSTINGFQASRAYASVLVGSDVSLQRARSWDESISYHFAATSLKDIFKVVCVAVNDPYVMNGWAEKIGTKDAVEFYADSDGSFLKKLDLLVDLSAALLGHQSNRWSAYVIDGKIKVLNVEKAPSEYEVSGGDVFAGQI